MFLALADQEEPPLTSLIIPSFQPYSPYNDESEPTEENSLIHASIPRPEEKSLELKQTDLSTSVVTNKSLELKQTDLSTSVVTTNL